MSLNLQRFAKKIIRPSRKSRVGVPLLFFNFWIDLRLFELRRWNISGCYIFKSHKKSFQTLEMRNFESRDYFHSYFHLEMSRKRNHSALLFSLLPMQEFVGTMNISNAGFNVAFSEFFWVLKTYLRLYLLRSWEKYSHST